MLATSKPLVFKTRSQWRQWLKRNGTTSDGVWLRMYKKHVRRGLQYSDAVEEALCYGWIDGQLRRVDDERHLIRFSRRRAGSVWAPSNIARVKKLIAAKKMTPAGLKLFQAADLKRQTATYTPIVTSLKVPADLTRALKKRAIAWKHWHQRPTSAKRIAIWWVTSAKKPETRTRRIANIVKNTATYARPHY